MPIDSPGQADACNHGTGLTYPWLGATDVVDGGTTDMHLSVTLQPPAINDEDVFANYKMTDVNSGATVFSGQSTNPFPDGGVTDTPITANLVDGHSYEWFAQAFVNGNNTSGDPGFTSSKSPTCFFSVDETAPSGLSVTSALFPPSGTLPGTTATAGTPGNDSGAFTLSAFDPVPTCTSCVASGVDEFVYRLNTTLPVTPPAPTSAANCPAGWPTAGCSRSRRLTPPGRLPARQRRPPAR